MATKGPFNSRVGFFTIAQDFAGKLRYSWRRMSNIWTPFLEFGLRFGIRVICGYNYSDWKRPIITSLILLLRKMRRHYAAISATRLRAVEH